MTAKSPSLYNVTTREFWHGPRWYDWDSIIFDVQVMDSRPILYERGCQIDGNKSRHDCTAACSNPKEVWTNNSYTLYNCMVYPILAQLIHSGSIIGKNSSGAAEFNIVNDSTSELFAGWPVITTCLTDYCHDNPHLPACTAKDSKTKASNSAYAKKHRLTYHELDFNVDICHNLNAAINPDIGGIGVFVSYLMQIAIVLSAWGLWHITEHWARYFYFAYWRMSKKNAARAWSLADAAQAKLKDSEVHNALLEALADFQKAQVFFMLAVQIACMIALHDLADIQGTSWQQFWNNIGIFFNLAVGGYLPVLLGLMILRQMGRKDSYSLIVSTCSVGLAIVTWLTTWELTIHRSEIQKVDIKSVGPPSCNGIAPTQYCWSFDWFWQNAVASSRGFGMIAFALVVQLCMIIDHLTVFKPAGESDDDRKRQNLFQVTRDWLLHRQEWEYYENLVQHQRCLIWLAKMKLDTRHSLFTRSKWFVLLGTEMALISLSILLLKAYGRLLVNHGVLGYLVLDHKAWSLGQIIAVTIWVPVLVKFVWDTLKGGGNADGGKEGIASGPYNRSYTGSTVGGGASS